MMKSERLLEVLAEEIDEIDEVLLELEPNLDKALQCKQDLYRFKLERRYAYMHVMSLIENN